MPRVGQARKRDRNEAEIVDALRAIGAHVTRISGPGAPDLLVRYAGRDYGLEVKGKRGKRTKAQERSQWPLIVTIDQALEAVGFRPIAEPRRHM